MMKRKYKNSRHAMHRKAIAFLLCIATALFMVPTMAFADVNPGYGTEPGETLPVADGGTSEQQIVSDGGPTSYGDWDNDLAKPYTWQENGFNNNTTQIFLSKTIRETDTENDFIIDLEVKTRQIAEERPSDTAVTLVLDVSGSMNYNIQNNSTATLASNSRIAALREAVIEFIYSYGTSSSDTGRWLSVVVFDQHARTRTYTPPGGVATIWFDASALAQRSDNMASPANNLANANNPIRQWVNSNVVVSSGTSGGTNTEAGLLLANNHMNMTTGFPTISGTTEPVADRYVFLFSDGAPCYTVNATATTTGTTTVPSTTNQTTQHGNATGTNGPVSDNPADGNRSTETRTGQGNLYAEKQAIAASDKIKAATNPRRAEVFAVGFGAGLNAYTETFLKQVVSDPAVDNEENGVHYFGTQSTGALLNAFRNILKQISTEAWTVIDPMAENITYTDYIDDKPYGVPSGGGSLTWINVLTEGNNPKVSNELSWNLVLSSYDEVTDDLGKWYIYKYSYTIHLDTDSMTGAEFEDTYPTNGRTYLRYYISVDNGTQVNRSALFDSDFLEIPVVKPYAKTIDFVKKDSVDNLLRNVGFTLFKQNDDGTWPTAGVVKTSGTNGEFSFGPLPVGNYRLVETDPPKPLDDYITSGPWYFGISYGQIVDFMDYSAAPDSAPLGLPLSSLSALQASGALVIINDNEGKIVIDKYIQSAVNSDDYDLYDPDIHTNEVFTFAVYSAIDATTGAPIGSPIATGTTGSISDKPYRVVFSGSDFKPDITYYVFETLISDSMYNFSSPYIPVVASGKSADEDVMVQGFNGNGYGEYNNDLKTGFLMVEKDLADGQDLEFFVIINGPSFDGTEVLQIYPKATGAFQGGPIEVALGDYTVTEVDKNGDPLTGWKPSYKVSYVSALGSEANELFEGGTETWLIGNEKIVGDAVLQVSKVVDNRYSVPRGYRVNFLFDIEQVERDGDNWVKVSDGIEPSNGTTLTISYPRGARTGYFYFEGLEEGDYWFRITERVPTLANGNPAPGWENHDTRPVIAKISVEYEYEGPVPAAAKKLVVLSDFADLSEAIEYAEGLDPNDFSDGWEALLAALDAAKAASSEDEVEALAALNAALDGLVSVSGGGGTGVKIGDPRLTVSYEYTKGTRERGFALFRNAYTPPSSSIKFSVDKTVFGEIPSEYSTVLRTFTFTLTETDSSGVALEDAVPLETTVEGTGTGEFASIPLKVGETRYFLIEEALSQDQIDAGWTSLGERYLIRVFVRDDMGIAKVYRTVTVLDEDGDPIGNPIGPTLLAAPASATAPTIGYEASFTNVVGTGTLTVGKEVEGTGYESELPYLIRIEFLLPDPNTYGADLDDILYQIIDTSGDALPDPAGQYTADYEDWIVTLLVGESIEFTNIPLGVLYEVEEILTDNAGGSTLADGYTFESIDLNGDIVVEAEDEVLVYEGSAIEIGENGVVTVNNLYTFIDVEVNIDTILRTSAAYSSSFFNADDEEILDDSLGGLRGVENVGEEQYIYEVNFRSTANVTLDSFIVDIPLEGVSQTDENGESFIRLEELYTPEVSSDLYDDWVEYWAELGYSESEIEALIDKFEIGVESEDVRYIVSYQTNMNPDWTIWAIPLSEFGEHLLVSDLPLLSDEWITGLQFNFGKVGEGFSSWDGVITNINDDYKDGDGDLDWVALRDKDIGDLDDDQIALLGGDTSSKPGPLAGIQSFLQSALFSLTSFFIGIAWAAEPPLDWSNNTGIGQPATLIVSANVPLSGASSNNIVGSAGVSALGAGISASSRDAVVTRNLGPQLSTAEIARMTGGPNGYTRYNEITRYDTANSRTGDAMNIQLMIILMAGSLAALLLLVTYMRSRKRKECAEQGTVEATQEQPKKKRFRKSSLLSLLIVGLLAGAAFQPAPVSAAAPPSYDPANGQYTYYNLDEGFTKAQLNAWFEELVDMGLFPAVLWDAIKSNNLIQYYGAVDVVVEHVAAVDLLVTTNDVDGLKLSAFDAKANLIHPTDGIWVESSADTKESIKQTTGLLTEVQLSEFLDWNAGNTNPLWAGKTACWERVQANGGVEFQAIEKQGNIGRPSLYNDEYIATVLYRGYEIVNGHTGFSLIIGDPLLADILNTYLVFIPGGIAAGAATAVIPPGDTPLAPGGGETVIPPVDTPQSSGTTIEDDKTPLEPGGGTDAGATGNLPWWAWVIIAAVIVIAVVLISRGVNRRKHLAEEE